MPTAYLFKDSKAADNVAKALLFVAKFSKKHAYVRFSDASVGVIWGGTQKGYYVHAETSAMDMFKHKQKIPYGVGHFTIIEVNPNSLGRTLKGNSHDRSVTVGLVRPNKLQVCVKAVDTSNRTITHTLHCDFKSYEDYSGMLIEDIETQQCRYNTHSYVENIHRLKHIVDTFVKLGTQRIYIKSKESNQGNDLTITARTQGATINVSLLDLESGERQPDEDDENAYRRQEAGVNIDTKKLAFFLSGLFAQKKSKVSIAIEHNKCLKITLDSAEIQGDKVCQSLLLLHSLHN